MPSVEVGKPPLLRAVGAFDVGRDGHHRCRSRRLEAANGCNRAGGEPLSAFG
jgi:hypothetical protein